MDQTVITIYYQVYVNYKRKYLLHLVGIICLLYFRLTQVIQEKDLKQLIIRQIQVCFINIIHRTLSIKMELYYRMWWSICK